MPQTSPMNWTILSTMMIMSMLNILSHNNEKSTMTNQSKNKFSLMNVSWNW